MISNTKHKLASYFKAGYSGLYVTSFEEQRVESELLAISQEIGFEVYTWTVLDSLIGPLNVPPKDRTCWKNKETGEPFGPIELLRAMNEVLPEKAIVLAKDFHLFVQEPNPLMIRAMKDALSIARVKARSFVVLGCQFRLVTELEKEFTTVDFALPDREQLGVVLDEIAKSAEIPLNGNTDRIKDAACGMTTTEAADAFALAVVESNKTEINPDVVSREKCNVVKKNGLLEIIEQRTKLDDIGGLEFLKADLWEKRNFFTKEAREYGISAPRGILVVGQAGTGKSLTASALGSIFNIPLVRLEAGRLFGQHVGESEQNWRIAFATAKAIAPCALWVDEADGLVSGAKSSGQTDGGTTARVVKAILQDMQFSSDGIMWAFTANDIDGFPDALIDRLDVWEVDLPTQTEREAIWAIHIAKRGRKPDKYSIPTIAKMTDGFSGRQIEQVWLAAMGRAFNDGKREPTTDDITEVASRCVPTAVTMAQQIEQRRKRLEGRAKAASQKQSVVTESRKGRKIST